MSHSDTTLHRLIDWVNCTRKHAPRLHTEADGVLARLMRLHYRQTQLDALNGVSLTLGLYGNSAEGKRHLLTTIAAGGRDGVYVQLGERTFNYLTHINPGSLSTAMAVRFTELPPPEVENYPLLLTLFRESELAIRLIDRYQLTAKPQTLSGNMIATTLAELKLRRSPQLDTGILAEEFTAIVQHYNLYQRTSGRISDSLCYEMAELAPWLSLSDRVTLLSLLWGKDRELSTQWLRQAQTLRHLGNATQVLAPASLVVDDVLLPAEGFLRPSLTEDVRQHTDVIVRPLYNDQAGLPQSLNLNHLSDVCAEVIFTLSYVPSLAGVDILDIPIRQLSYYQARLQPDTLLICNAASSGQAVTPIARRLSNWLDETQCQEHSSLPRLVWAITPFDKRFTQGEHIDDGVQRAITRSGKRWGTLQALDNRNTSCLHEWLSSALSITCRQQRLTQLQQTLNQQAIALFNSINRRTDEAQTLKGKQQTKDLILALQANAEKHGETINYLMLSREALHQCWLQHHQQTVNKSTSWALSVDLFDETQQAPDAGKCDNRFATRVYALWINHLREQACRPSPVLSLTQTQTLCEIFIALSDMLALEKTLAAALTGHDDSATVAIARADNVFSTFISWLGYHNIEAALRPQSRVTQGEAIFAPAPQADASARLTQLGGTDPHANARYVFDWLVALMARADETSCYTLADDVSQSQLQALGELIDELKKGYTAD